MFSYYRMCSLTTCRCDQHPSSTTCRLLTAAPAHRRTSRYTCAVRLPPPPPVPTSSSSALALNKPSSFSHPPFFPPKPPAQSVCRLPDAFGLSDIPDTLDILETCHTPAWFLKTKSLVFKRFIKSNARFPAFFQEARGNQPPITRQNTP